MVPLTKLYPRMLILKLTLAAYLSVYLLALLNASCLWLGYDVLTFENAILLREYVNIVLHCNLC